MPLKVGSQGELVNQWVRTMNKRFSSYSREKDGTPLKVDGYFGYPDRDVQMEYERRTGQVRDGVVSDADLVALGLAEAEPLHALLTFSGTWAAPGTGYPSWVAQRCSGVVEEIPVQSPWSFGPVGGDVQSPSYKESVAIAVEWAVAWLLAHPNRTFLLGGYSQGAEAASRVYMELLPGGRLVHLRKNFVGGFGIGNPCRQKGHTYYGGSDPGGQGIATVRLKDMPVCWLECAKPGDLYTTCPDDKSGEIETSVYEIATSIGLGDPLGLVQAFIKNALAIVDDLGGLPGIVGGLGAGLIPAVLLGVLAGVLNKPTTDAGLAAAIKAAITGIKFIAANPPTEPHITYEFPIPDQPWWSYIDLAVQHVKDWSGRVPARV